MIEKLGEILPQGETTLAAILHDLARRIKRRGLIIICSDCFDDIEKFFNALHHLNFRGHEILLLHIMAPEEISFPLNRWSRFESMEVMGERIDIDPAVMRKHYLARLKTFLDRLQYGCGEVNCDYVPLTTDKSLADSLMYYLSRRAALMK